MNRTPRKATLDRLANSVRKSRRVSGSAFYREIRPSWINRLSTVQARELTYRFGTSVDPEDRLTNLFLEIESDYFNPTHIAHTLVQIGVCDPESCTCYEDEEDRPWHGNHRAFNARAHDLISRTKGLRNMLRRVIRADIKIAKTDSAESDVPTGQIVSLSLGESLLDHFLTASPSWA